MSQAPQPRQGLPRFVTPNMDPRPMRPDKPKSAQPRPDRTPRQRFAQLYPDQSPPKPHQLPTLQARLAACLKPDGTVKLGYAVRAIHIRAAITRIKALAAQTASLTNPSASA